MNSHRKRIFHTAILVVFLFLFQGINAQETRLHFDDKGQFKIAQFTDTHFFIGGAKSPQVIDNMRVVMESEEPDLVILTGDIVTGNKKEGSAFDNWDIITNLFIEYKVPYAVAFGNHDDEAEVSRQEVLNYLSSRPLCLISDEGGEDIKGVGNYVLPVSNGKGEAEKLLYCLDSRSYSLKKGVDGYGWFDHSQVGWFARTNQAWLAKNRNIQSLLFFHIPLPEYKEAFDGGQFRNGVRMEEECAPKINTGMFSEMVLQGNVLGTFVGHDHNNNYVAQLFNIALCYGYFSGGNSYQDLPLNGARIILLEEKKQSFTTWLRRVDGRVLYKIELPQKTK